MTMSQKIIIFIFDNWIVLLLYKINGNKEVKNFLFKLHENEKKCVLVIFVVAEKMQLNCITVNIRSRALFTSSSLCFSSDLRFTTA